MKKRMMVLLMCFATSITFAQNYKFGKVSKEELAEKAYPLDSTAKAAYLLKSRDVRYEYDGNNGWRLVTEVHERIKLYSKEAEDYAQNQIRLFNRSGVSEHMTSLKAYTYNLVGGKIKKEKLSKRQVFKEKLSKNWKIQKFTMPNLKDGSVVEWSYKITSPYYSNIDEMRFQNGIPIKKLDYLVRVPEYFVFKVNYQGYLQMYFKNTMKNRTINYSYRTNGDNTRVGGLTTKYNEKVDLREKVYELVEENIPALRDDEPFVSNINNYRRGAKFELTMTNFPRRMPKYFTTTWEDVSKRIYRTANFGVELNKRSYFKNDLGTLLEKATTPAAKIGAIFNFVKRKVRWNGNYGKYTVDGVKKAYKEGVGNVAEINLMLTAMLRAAGLDANPVLVSSKNNGIPFFPTLEGFNYVISSVNIQGKYVLLDASDVFSLPNVLPLRAINWKGRIVKDNLASAWISLMPRQHSETTNFMSVEINEDLDLTGMMRTIFKNHEAISFRKRKSSLKNEELINSFEDKYNVEIDDYKLVNKDNIYKPITRVVKFSGEDFLESINDKLYISPLLFLKSTSNPFKLDERKFPVDFRIPIKHKSSVSIKLPKGYKVETLPENKAIVLGDNEVTFGYKVVPKGNKINVISRFQVNATIINADAYKELKELFNQMIKKQNEKIVLVKE